MEEGLGHVGGLGPEAGEPGLRPPGVSGLARHRDHRVEQHEHAHRTPGAHERADECAHGLGDDHDVVEALGRCQNDVGVAVQAHVVRTRG
jgi:hypothetical protein